MSATSPSPPPTIGTASWSSAKIRSLRTHFVYLTATLPPTMQAEFEERNHLCHPAIMRASTNRPNIFYTVQQCPSGQGSLLSQVATDVLESWLKLVSADQDKAVLYVRSRDEARDLAALLECDVYVGGDSLTNAEKSAFLQQWTSNPQRSFLVATTALAEASTIPWSV
jgi:superfamily II DNA helicase RecQ